MSRLNCGSEESYLPNMKLPCNRHSFINNCPMQTERPSLVQQIVFKMNSRNNSASSHEPNMGSLLRSTLDRSQIKSNLRSKYKKSWKAPGFCSTEFSTPGFGRAQILNSWDQERINMSTRSYTAPKKFKGFRVRQQYQQFASPGLNGLSNRAKEYFKQCEYDNQSRQLRTLQVTREYDDKISRMRESSRMQFRVTNTTQSNRFGCTSNPLWRTKALPAIHF